MLRLHYGTIETNGAATDYFTFGHGTKNLVILPGLSTRSILYSAMSIPSGYRIFSEDYTVWVIDRRASMPQAFTVRQMAADIAAAMRGLGIGTADVFGASLGGMVSARRRRGRIPPSCASRFTGRRPRKTARSRSTPRK